MFSQFFVGEIIFFLFNGIGKEESLRDNIIKPLPFAPSEIDILDWITAAHQKTPVDL